MLCAIIVKNVLQNSRNGVRILTTMHAIQEYKVSSLKSKSMYWSDGFDILQFVPLLAT
jgi:hypothetical protein